MLMLGAGYSVRRCAGQTPAAPAGKPAAAQAKDAAPSAILWAPIPAPPATKRWSKEFANNPHTKMALMHGDAGVTCENCHGAGKAHVEGGGDVTKIFNPAKATAKEVDAKCLSCHAGSASQLRSLAARQGRRKLHQLPQRSRQQGPEHLLKAAQPTLCFQCHTDVKPQFAMPFHHKVNEGLVKCSDCHDVHGTFGNNNLKSTADQNAVCTKCHAETRGPFVYEHAAVKAEGCMGCHTPHGSQNARLLNMPNINSLCNQCHSPVAAGTVHGMGAGSAELHALHQLPHLYSWVQHECGVPAGKVWSRAAPSRPSDGAARIPDQIGTSFKVSMSAKVFSSEASYEERQAGFLGCPINSPLPQ